MKAHKEKETVDFEGILGVWICLNLLWLGSGARLACMTLLRSYSLQDDNGATGTSHPRGSLGWQPRPSPLLPARIHFQVR